MISARVLVRVMRPTMVSAGVLVRAMRPRQWPKNILVPAAPAAAGVLFQPRAALGTGVAILAFILASSGVYLANDIVDIGTDLAHPRKRLRPVASGELSVPHAVVSSVALLGAGLAIAALVAWQMLAIIGLYEAVQLLYSLRLKGLPLVELVVVASGFLLRAVAGGAATGVGLTAWFVVAIGCGSLFVIAGKRYSELLADAQASRFRPVLARYTAFRLRLVWTLSGAVLVATYALWAAVVRPQPDWWAIGSVAPFAVAVVRYAAGIAAGGAAEPEETFLHDHLLQLLMVAWAVCFVASIYF